jgi:hypothetical protein
MELCLIHRTITADLRPVRNGGLSPALGPFLLGSATPLSGCVSMMLVALQLGIG